MFAMQDVVLFAVLAGVLAGVVLAAFSPWARERGRFAVAGATTAVGFVLWYLTLNATGAEGFNVDAPVIPISWADAGSGVLAFAVTALVLGLLTERGQPAWRVVGTAAIAGMAATVLDIFVL